MLLARTLSCHTRHVHWKLPATPKAYNTQRNSRNKPIKCNHARKQSKLTQTHTTKPMNRMQTCNKTNTTYANTPDNKQIKCKHARKQTKPMKQTTPIQTCKKTNETIKNPPLTALPAHCLD